ncbi:MAG TPA: hypothetical protein VGG10_08335 [Rhizomicrobium sp.]|jgi:hypothetical protein
MNWKQLLAINLAVSLLLPAILGFLKVLDLFQSTELAILTFILVTCIELLDSTNKMRAIRTEEHRSWTERDEFDALLASIRSDYRNMRVRDEGEDADLVRELVRLRVQSLRDEVHNAAERKVLYADNNHALDTTQVLNLFEKGKASTFREIFQITDGDEIFGLYGGRYAKRLYELTRTKHITEIRVLIVVDFQNSPAVAKGSDLISFYQNTPGYSARVISKLSFEQLRQDSRLEDFEDFGIYGEILLFRTLGYVPTNKGTYCYDAAQIKKHKEFFEACWTLPAPPVLPAASKVLDIDEVLRL